MNAIRTLWLLVLLFVMLAGAMMELELLAMTFSSAVCAVICMFSIMAINDGTFKEPGHE